MVTGGEGIKIRQQSEKGHNYSGFKLEILKI